jgi:hypothetical protein
MFTYFSEEVPSSSSGHSYTPQMEAEFSSETWVNIYQTTRRNSLGIELNSGSNNLGNVGIA